MLLTYYYVGRLFYFFKAQTHNITLLLGYYFIHGHKAYMLLLQIILLTILYRYSYHIIKVVIVNNTKNDFNFKKGGEWISTINK